MRRKGVRATAAAMAATMGIGLLAGCSSTGASTGASDETTNLVGYVLGDRPAGMDDVEAKLNETLKGKCNATVELRYLSWGEYAEKYPLILASGEDIDFIYTGSWCMYAQEAQKNAFYEITKEDLEKYMPLHWAAVKDTNAFDQTLINDKSYMITTSSPDEKAPVVIYRKDICDKYGVAYPEKMSDFTDYFEAIKENEPDMSPMYLDSQYDLSTPFGNLEAEYGDTYIDVSGTSGICIDYSLEDASKGNITLTKVSDSPIAESYKYAADIMKQWYDAGYVNKDIFSNDVRSKDAFVEGKSGIGLGNSLDMAATDAAAAAAGYDVGYVKSVNKYGHCTGDTYIGNGVAIAATCKNPTKAMEVLDVMMEDPDTVNLLYYGIEGVNYVNTDDDKVTNPEGVTNDNNTYPADGAGLWFINRSIPNPSAAWTDSYIDLKNSVSDCLIYHDYAGFTIDTSTCETEIANCQNVMAQYASPIFVGMVDDVDASLKTLSDQLEAAGVDDLQKELQKQTDEYMKK